MKTNRKPKQKAFVLVYALLFMSGLLVIMGSVLETGTSELTASTDEENSLEAFYAADTAIECVRFMQERYGAFNTTVPQASYNCGIGADFNAGGLATGGTSAECQSRSYAFTLSGFTNGACANVAVTVAGNTTDPSLCDAFFTAEGRNSCTGASSIPVERTRWEEWIGLPNGSGSITNGLVGHWELNESSGTLASDSSPSNADGTLYDGSVVGNGPIWEAAGPMDGALAFDGIDDYVNIGNPSELQLTGAMTISAWVRMDTTGTLNSRVITKSGPIGQRGWDMTGENDNKMYFKIAQNGTTNIEVGSSGTIPIGEWVHWAGVYEPGSSLRLYKNGVLDNSNTSSIPSTQYNATNNVWIGDRTNCSPCEMDGILDDVRVYNRALAPQEISALYSLGNPP